MASEAVTMRNPDACDLCGAHIDGGARDRLRHLKGSHPAYARAALFRVAAPGLFLVEVLIIALAHAQQWVYLVALFSSFAFLFFGKQISRKERARAGTTPTMPFKRLLREGGLAFLLVVPIIALLVALLGRR